MGEEVKMEGVGLKQFPSESLFKSIDKVFLD